MLGEERRADHRLLRIRVRERIVQDLSIAVDACALALGLKSGRSRGLDAVQGVAVGY